MLDWARSGSAVCGAALSAYVVMGTLTQVSLAEWLAHATRKFGHLANGVRGRRMLRVRFRILWAIFHFAGQAFGPCR
jgi:hypothetical protein